MGSKIPDETLLDSIRELADLFDRPPTSTEYGKHGEYTYQTARNRFGSWEAAIEAAGLEYSQVPTGSRPGPTAERLRCYSCGSAFQSDGTAERVKCPECGAQITRWRARVAHGGAVQAIRKIATEGPLIEENLSSFPGWVRGHVFALRVPNAGPGSRKSRPGVWTKRRVLYLPGQERAAVSMFIEANTEYVADCLSDGQNPLREHWPEDLYQLLIEQWHWTGRGDLDADNHADVVVGGDSDGR